MRRSLGIDHCFPSVLRFVASLPDHYTMLQRYKAPPSLHPSHKEPLARKPSPCGTIVRCTWSRPHAEYGFGLVCFVFHTLKRMHLQSSPCTIASRSSSFLSCFPPLNAPHGMHRSSTSSCWRMHACIRLELVTVVAAPSGCLHHLACGTFPCPRVFARVYLQSTGARPSHLQRVARACSALDGRHLRREEVSGGGQRTHRPKDRCVARGSEAKAEESGEETLVWDEMADRRWRKSRRSDAKDATCAWTTSRGLTMSQTNLQSRTSTPPTWRGCLAQVW